MFSPAKTMSTKTFKNLYPIFLLLKDFLCIFHFVNYVKWFEPRISHIINRDLKTGIPKVWTVDPCLLGLWHKALSSQAVQ